MRNKLSQLFSSKKFLALIGFLGLYLISTGFSWLIFSSLGKEPDLGPSLTGLASERAKIDESVPKTEICPTNGAMFTKIEKQIWDTRHPILAIVENHSDARPQSGLSRADVVYEAVAEGGITRMLAVFYCGAAKEDVTIGPLRSARVYFIDWAQEYSETPLFVHFGGANNICGSCPGGVKFQGQVAKEVRALERLVSMGWRHSAGNALDGGANVSYPAIKRDQTRLGEVAAWEHSAIGSTDLLFELGQERGFAGKSEDGDMWYKNFVSWKFTDDKPTDSPDASDISFGFWSNKADYDVSWKYDKVTNNYNRFSGGQKQIDLEFGKPQLTAKNIVIMFVDEKGPVDKELHMFYKTTGKGDAIIFQNGTVIEGLWEKPAYESRTKFYDESGKEVEFVRGVIWIEAIPTGVEIEYN